MPNLRAYQHPEIFANQIDPDQHIFRLSREDGGGNKKIKVRELLSFINTGETDPVFDAHVASSITQADINLWNTALQPGDNISTLVNDAGYITSFTETDPIFIAWRNAGLAKNAAQTINQINWFTQQYRDATNTLAANMGTGVRSLYDDTGVATIDFGSVAGTGFLGTGGTPYIAWNTITPEITLSLGGIVGINIDTGVGVIINDVSGGNSISGNFDTRRLFASTDQVNPSVDWEGYALHLSNSATETVNWNFCVLKDPANVTSIDWTSRFAAATNGTTTIEWSIGAAGTGCSLTDDNNVLSIWWGQTGGGTTGRRLYDTAGTLAEDWLVRGLYDISAVLSVDWTAKKLWASGVHSIDWVLRRAYTNGSGETFRWGISTDSVTEGFQVATNVNWGFDGVVPSQTQTGWTTSNVTTDRILDANSTTLDEVADVLCTLVEDLKTKGILQA